MARELGYTFGWGAWFDVVLGVASVAEDGDELGCAAAVAYIIQSVDSHPGNRDVEDIPMTTTSLSPQSNS